MTQRKNTYRHITRTAERLRLLCLPVLSLLFVACTDNEVYETRDGSATDMPITFEPYVTQPTKSRAVYRGSIDSNTTLRTAGFGLYGYRTGGAYSSTHSSLTAADVMMNETHVAYDGSAWSYSPTVYWGNESADRHSFFAYAPYAYSNASSDYYAAWPGIAPVWALSSPTTDPTVSYTTSTQDPSLGIDLMWGTDASGNPYTDQEKPSINSPIKFYFHHALARLGFTAQAYVDAVNDNTESAGTTSTGLVGGSSDTRIYIESIHFYGKESSSSDASDTQGPYATGSLNLNNTTANTPLWTGRSTRTNLDTYIPYSGDNSVQGSTAIKDVLYRSDGTDLWRFYSGVQATLGRNATDLMDGSAGSYRFKTAYPGVTETPVNPLADDSYYMVIPDDAEHTYTIRVTYYVTTIDDNLTSGYYDRKNSVSQDVTLQFVAGNTYIFHLVFGLTSFKINVESVAWEDETPATPSAPYYYTLWDGGTTGVTTTTWGTEFSETAFLTQTPLRMESVNTGDAILFTYEKDASSSPSIQLYLRRTVDDEDKLLMPRRVESEDIIGDKLLGTIYLGPSSDTQGTATYTLQAGDAELLKAYPDRLYLIYGTGGTFTLKKIQFQDN